MKARGIRVLMLGWEYPPRLAGGLGKACQGLSQAMARAGAQVYFVLPTFPTPVSERGLEVIGARECLLDAGWEMKDIEAGVQELRSEVLAELVPGLYSEERISVLGILSNMHPYEQPEGPMPAAIAQTLESSQVSSTAPGGALKKRYGFKGPPAEQKNAQPSFSAAASGGQEIYGRNLWQEIERFAVMVGHLSDSHEVDVVHAHDWMTFPAAFAFSRATGTPVFLHVHATEYDRSGENVNNEIFRIEREGFHRATHIFAVSRYTAGVIHRLYGVSRSKISVIYNAPEDSMLVSAGSPDAPRKPHVIFLGRLTFQKGPDHFLRAAAIVAQSNPTARFVMCGTGDMMEKLKQLAEKLGIRERVDFAGFVDPSGVDEVLLNSKVLVMPSVSEPFGLVALEAIRCGMPIIISKQSGVREVLQSALQVDFWDHEKLADQILAALRLPGLSRQLVDDGMDQLRGLSWEKSAQKVLESYGKELGSTYAQSRGGTHGH